MILYEIHLFRDGTWKVDSVFDDRELAVYEAQRVEKTGRFPAVRVLEEIYDEATERTKTRTVYRSSKLDKENLESGKRRAQAPVLTAPPPRRARPKRGISNTFLVFNVLFIVAIAAGALFLLRYLSDRL